MKRTTALSTADRPMKGKPPGITPARRARLAKSTDTDKPLRRVRGFRHPLAGLRNVGPATCADFDRLGISSLAQLARSDPDELYWRLETIDGKRHDPCVWDVFAAAIFEAQTGEARAWWTFTPIRKARAQRGELRAR